MSESMWEQCCMFFKLDPNAAEDPDCEVKVGGIAIPLRVSQVSLFENRIFGTYWATRHLLACDMYMLTLKIGLCNLLDDGSRVFNLPRGFPRRRTGIRYVLNESSSDTAQVLRERRFKIENPNIYTQAKRSRL